MFEGSLKICGAAIICVILIVTVRQAKSDMALLLKIAAAVVLCTGVIATIQPIIGFLSELSEGLPLDIYVGTLVKALCVGFLSHICALICRECGEATIASFAELGGKIEILLISLPLFREIIGYVSQILDMI